MFPQLVNSVDTKLFIGVPKFGIAEIEDNARLDRFRFPRS